MTVNKGQSELLMNFICSARYRGLDLQNVILFPTDQFSKDIADSLDLATFYHEEVSTEPSSMFQSLINVSYYNDWLS